MIPDTPTYLRRLAGSAVVPLAFAMAGIVLWHL